jgi:DNA invertase Pin-like site-specific DNA recombinase
VAAYTRVSSDSEDQENSFAAQNSYYTTLLTSTPDWEMVDIYADEGITGTSMEKRDDFQRLIADCHRGLIDRIVVKSISRFARNTLECLETIRELKDIGVSVFFEEQNIDTAEMSSEMVTAIHASFAQTESINISKNMRWSYQKRMQSGTFITCKSPYGYRLKNGTLEVNEAEAMIVQQIYDHFLTGQSYDEIAADLTAQGIAARDGSPHWSKSTVSYILKNEHYMGDSLLQKYYTTDTLPFRQLENHGEKDQYYIEGSHPAIISKDIFEAAQALIRKRAKGDSSKWSSKLHLSGRIKCGNCGNLFRKRMNRSILYWACRTYDANTKDCPIRPILQSEVHNAFLRLYYTLKHSPILQQMLSDLHTIRERRLLWREDVVELNKQISELTSQNQMLAELKKLSLIDPDIFIAQANELAKQLRDAKLHKERLLSSLSDHSIDATQELLSVLNDGPDFLDAFDPEMFDELIDQIIVEDNEHIRFRLKNGLELPELIERTVR